MTTPQFVTRLDGPSPERDIARDLVLKRALPGAPGHELWKRDFTGACSLFGVEFKPEFPAASTHKFVEALELFGIELRIAMANTGQRSLAEVGPELVRRVCTCQ